MASSDTQILVAGTAPVPLSYEVPNSQEIEPLAVAADFDGTLAAGAFLPTLVIQSDAGLVVARVPVSASVAAGGSASVTWAPFLRAAAASGGGGAGTAITALFGSLAAYGVKAETPCSILLVNGAGNPLVAGTTSLMGTIFPFGFAKGEVLTGLVLLIRTFGATPGATFSQLAICDVTGTIVAVSADFTPHLVGSGSRVPLKVPFTAPYTVTADGEALYALFFMSHHWSSSPTFAEYTPNWAIPPSANAWRPTMGGPPPAFFGSPFAAFPLGVGQVLNLDTIGNQVGLPIWLAAY